MAHKNNIINNNYSNLDETSKNVLKTCPEVRNGISCNV